MSEKKRLELIFRTLESILHQETRYPEQLGKLMKDLKRFLYVDVNQVNEWALLLRDYIEEGKLSNVVCHAFRAHFYVARRRKG
jgi:hypothetical protein